MTDNRLAGKKVAIVVESQYIPAEIKIYQQGFAFYGATVDLVSRLWGNPTMRFYSTIEPGVQDQVEWIDVSLDFEHVNVDDYVAVIVAANYVSVRLRWSERDDLNSSNAGAVVRDVPAVRFLQRAMANRRIIKGMPCHALWLLTPSPELLSGRRVICNKVVLADVLNAGAIYTPCAPNTPEGQRVVVDGDLVTNDGWHSSQRLVDQMAELLLRPATASNQACPHKGESMNKRVLAVLSEWGFWGEELIGPLEVFDDASFATTFATPTGARPVALPVSKDPTFVDPPLGKRVVSESVAAKVAAIDDPANPRLANPINLHDWFPNNPYPSSANYLREKEAYFAKLDERKDEISGRFDALLLVGGSGAVIDMMNNFRLQDLIRCFFELGKPIIAECYSIACLAFTIISEDDRRPIVSGKHVTGHPSPYDYTTGFGFWPPQRVISDLAAAKPDYVASDFPLIPHQLVMELAVGPEGCFHGNVGKELSVIVDYPFITGRSVADSFETGKQAKKVLEDEKHRRYGW
jgi:putative intracellular protease/amidase